MNAEQQQRALQMLRRFEQADPMTRQADNAAVDMAALLRELVAEQPTSVPVLTVECEPDYWSGGHYHEGTLPHIDPTAVWKLPIGTELYTSPPANNQSEQHLEMVNAPAPSVPDSKTLQFLTDVLTAAGLLRHGKKDAGLATRIADESCRIRQQLFTQPEQPADVAQDAERYRAIRGGIVDIRDCGNTVAVEYKSVVRYCRSDEDFDQEIDAAIAAEKGGA